MTTTRGSQVSKARWTRLAALGFALAAAAPLLLLVAAAAFGLDLDDGMFFVIPAVVLAGVSAAVLRAGTWAKITGIVLGLLAGLMFFWFVFGLFTPGSFFDFTAGVLFVPGVLLGIGSSIAGIRAARRGDVVAAAKDGEARGIRVVVGAIAALVLISGVLTVAGRSTADPASADAQVSMKNFEFGPEEMTVSGGSTIHVENDDPFLHTFTIDELDIDVTLSVGESVLVDLPATSGTYVFYCVPHSSSDPDPTDPDSDDMAGTITIT